MELAERVKILEQEVDILKNQIQATLLNIQEQMLTNKYPSIRSQEATSQIHTQIDSQPPSAPTSLIQTVRDIPETSAPAPAIHRVAAKDIQKELPTETYSEPEPEMSMVQVKELPAGTPTYSDAELDWALLEDLEEWVCNKVDRIGPERTRRLIAKYAEQGRFDIELEEALLDLVLVYSGEANHKSAININGHHNSGNLHVQPFEPMLDYETSFRSEHGGNSTIWDAFNGDDEVEDDYYEDAHIEEEHAHSDKPVVILEREASRNLILKLINGIRNGNSA